MDLNSQTSTDDPGRLQKVAVRFLPQSRPDMLNFSHKLYIRRGSMEKLALERLATGLERGESPVQAVSAAKEVLYVVVPGGSAAGIPTAECLSRHLPPGRQPTRAEIAAALAECKAESKKHAY